MKNTLLVVCFLIFQGSVFGKSLEAFFSYCTFNSPESGPYIEMYLSIAGHSVYYQPVESGAVQGSIEVTYIFRQGDEIKDFKKFNMLSPELSDTTKGFSNFLDQQRIQLPNGDYELEILLSDNYSSDAPFSAIQPFKLDYSDSEVEFSEIQLLETYRMSEKPGMLTKSGYDLVPYVTDFFPSTAENLSFYAEIYNTELGLGADARFLVNYYLESYNSKRPLGNFKRFLRQTAGPVNVILSQFDITNLPSGDYNLVLEVRDRENKLVKDKRLFFHRENDATALTPEEVSANLLANSFAGDIDNRDTLVEFIQSLRPISNEKEKQYMKKSNIKAMELPQMQRFFLTFWMNRNSIDPEYAWIKYKEEVTKVNAFFGTSIKKGWQTDRGRVYLQYGPPNTRIQRKNDPGSYPYEIWHYYKTKLRSDAKFVFYDNDLSTNDYELLHSNVRGEINDFRWQVKLQMRSGMPANIDNGTMQDQYGNPAQDLFEMPR